MTKLITTKINELICVSCRVEERTLKYKKCSIRFIMTYGLLKHPAINEKLNDAYFSIATKLSYLKASPYYPCRSTFIDSM